MDGMKAYKQLKDDMKKAAENYSGFKKSEVFTKAPKMPKSKKGGSKKGRRSC
jgi:hypothetical protein